VAAATAPTPAAHFVVEWSGSEGGLARAVASVGGELLRVHPEVSLAIVGGIDEGQATRLQRQGNIRHVVRDLLVQWIPRPVGPIQAVRADISGDPPPLPPEGAVFYGCQWNLWQIDAPGAWSSGEFGDPDVKVAVLDTGIDPTHLSLSGKVDLANSRSFIDILPSPCGDADQNTILDYNFHGTFVASQIASNGVGMASVAPNSQIVALKTNNCDGVGAFGDIVSGIVYAAGLDDVAVINMSLGAIFPKSLPGQPPAGLGLLVAYVNRAINYAASRGVLSVSAAGNEGLDLQHSWNLISLPAEAGTGVSVYATDNADGLASYSNYGVSATWVGAPGGDFPNASPPLPQCPFPDFLQGALLGACSSYQTALPFACDPFSYVIGGTGTSFASPMVAGVAALVQGKHGGALRPQQLKGILKRSADDLGDPGVDPMFSHGRVNAAAAVAH
jgi:subtilisin family serine protease